MYKYRYTHLEPNRHLFLKVNPPQKQGRNSNGNKGPHLGSRYIYIQKKIYIYRIFVATLFFMQTQSPGRWSSSRLLSPPAAPENSQRKALRIPGNQLMCIYIHIFIPIPSMYGQVRFNMTVYHMYVLYIYSMLLGRWWFQPTLKEYVRQIVSFSKVQGEKIKCYNHHQGTN